MLDFIEIGTHNGFREEEHLGSYKARQENPDNRIRLHPVRRVIGYNFFRETPVMFDEQMANCKDPDQNARMCRLTWRFAVRKVQWSGFSCDLGHIMNE